MSRLAIIGLGLIGGSLGLALKRAGLEDLEVVGYDAEPGVGARARKLGAIDREARDPASAVEDAGAVIIATPISQVVPVLEEIAPALDEDAVVTDTASTKREIVRRADELLSGGASFVGGHPLAGKERSGIDAADASLFEGRPWAITPSPRASEQAVQAVENLVALVGARPVCIDAAEHDSYVAAVSHLPLVAAVALFSLAKDSQAWPELAALAGPGFRDTTRLASTNPELSLDIASTNRDNVLHWLDRYVEELRRLRALLADEGRAEELRDKLATVRSDRDAFLEAPPARPAPEGGARAPSPGEAMRSIMLGEYVTRRTQELEKLLRREDDDPRRGREER